MTNVAQPPAQAAFARRLTATARGVILPGQQKGGKMKKAYVKPALTKRQSLSAVTAAVPVSQTD